MKRVAYSLLLVFLAFGIFSRQARTQAPSSPQSVTVRPRWDNIVATSESTPTLQVVVNPPLRRGSGIHDRVFQALHDLGADYVRYVPWLPYPKLAVAELEPPADGKTSWDFSLIDPMMEDFMKATAGHSVIINFSTIPQWMWQTPHPIAYPSDPNQVTWNYEQGTHLVDPSMKQVADYYARLVSWYTRGGFTDEYGHKHTSGHFYHIAWWEVLNEVNAEHHMSPEFYTHLYDAITAAIHKVNPSIQFMGLALAGYEPPQYFTYFLNPKNHRPGAPLDMVSYHFYASPSADASPDTWQYTFFDQARGFLDSVAYIQSVRQRLSPNTKTDTDELGCILPNDNATPRASIPAFYWNLCGSMYAYLYGNLARLGVNVVGESQLVGYPSQFPSVSMVNWNTGQPNARFWILKLLHDNFGPGDKLAAIQVSVPYVYAQAFVAKDGRKKILLVNQRNRPFRSTIAGAAGSEEEYVDETTGEKPPASEKLRRDTFTLRDFGVAVVTLP